MGIPCRLVKGRQYTGSDDAAINFVKIDDGRLFTVLLSFSFNPFSSTVFFIVRSNSS